MGLLVFRAKAQCNIAGTGAVTPGAAITKFQSWAAAGAVAGFWYDYLLEQGNDWESGVGFYNGTTITRPGPSIDPWFRSSTGSLLSISVSDSISCVANENTLMAGGPFMPPVASYFPNNIGSTGAPVLSFNKATGLHYAFNGAPVSGDKGRGAYKTITAAGDWQMVAHVYHLYQPANWIYGGIFVGRSGARNLLYGPIAGGYGPSLLNLDGTMNSNAGTGVPGVSTFAGPGGWYPAWFRIRYTASSGNLAFDQSVNGSIWMNSANQTVAGFGFGGAPDKIGVAVGTNLAGGAEPTLDIPYWWDNA